MTREKAIELVKEAMPTLWKETKEAIQTLIPELAESEDEKIRKDIINLIYWLKGNPSLCSQYYIDRYNGMLAWLEKQKEQKHVEWSEKDKCVLNTAINVFSGTDIIEDINRNYIINGLKDILHSHRILTECSEEDESIIEGACDALEIHGHSKLASMLKSLRPQHHWKPSEEQKSVEWSEDERIRKWLYDYISNCPNNNFDFYGGVGKDAVLNYLKKQKEQKTTSVIRIPKFRVGDIIQHVPLEKWDRSARVCAIDENGYSVDYTHIGDSVSGGYVGFSFENEYELVEQKPTEWSEDERIRSCICHALTDVDEQRFTDFGVTLKDCLAYLERRKEQKPVEQNNATINGEPIPTENRSVDIPLTEWNEEDKHRLMDAIYFLETAKAHYADTSEIEKTIDWLKSLLERFNLQLKQEWSEEDKEMLNNIVVFISGYADKRVVSRWVEFLKSLRPQPKQELFIEKAIQWFDDTFFFQNNSSGRGEDYEITTHDFDSLEEMYDSFRKAVGADFMKK